MITKTKNQIQKMGNDIEGMLNDFEGGITEKEETIVNIIDYIIQRAEATLNNFKSDLMISVENRRKFYLENNRPDNASTLGILYNDIKNDQLLDFMKKDGLPVEAQVMPKIAEEDGCSCQKCGKKFKVDFYIPDELWLKISPKKSEGGLLCGMCITEAIENFNEYNAFKLEKC